MCSADGPSSTLLPLLWKLAIQLILKIVSSHICFALQKLIALEPKISQCDMVIKFFEAEAEDVDIPTEYVLFYKSMT